MHTTTKAAQGLFALAAAAILALCAMAFAPGTASADEPPTADGNEVTITKKLVGATTTLPESDQFTFSFTKVSVNDLTATTDLDTMPAIADKTIEIGTEAGKYASKKTEGATTTLRNDLKFDVDDLAFTHAGVYKYLVKETGKVADITMSQAEYTLVVYVKNNDQSGVDIDKVVIEQGKGDSGAAQQGKVDPNPKPTDPNKPDTPDNPGQDIDGGSGFVFVNSVTSRNIEYYVMKEVEGEYADTTKDFQFTMTLTVPTTAAAKPDGYKAIVQDLNHSADVVATYTFVPGVPTEFTLKHNYRLCFTVTEAGEGDKIPDGTVFTYTEKGVDGYTASSRTPSPVDGDSITQQGTEGADFTLTPAAAVSHGEGGSTLTNTYKAVTPTGIAMNVLPFVLMIVVPILAAVGYVAFKRRLATRV